MPYKSKPHLLIVEDEPGTLTALATLFEPEFRVDALGTAAEALHAMKSRTHAVALVDILLPDKGGEELLKALKGSWPLTEVVVLTALQELDLAKRCYALGAYDFLTKPYDNENLVRVVRRAADKYELARLTQALRAQLAQRSQIAKVAPSKNGTWPSIFQKISKLVSEIIAVKTHPSGPKLKKMPSAVTEFERQLLLQALALTQWNQLQSARLLGVHRNTVVQKMKKYKITSLKRPRGLKKKRR